MKRNIKLSKLITISTQTWFWLGIWVPYYLKFTNFAGIGIIESTVIITLFLLEIPTGALADLIGKKKTIIFSLAFTLLGNILMTFSSSLIHLLISVTFLGVGGSLFSGTNDALIYDSLKQVNKESLFDKTLSSIHKLSLASMAIASMVGGFLYTVNPRLPFITTALVIFIAFVFSFFIEEPIVDTETFSLKNYLKQNKKGFEQLFATKVTTKVVLRMVIIFSFAFILMEFLETAMALNFGFTEQQLGILYGIVPLISALGAHFYPYILKKISFSNLWKIITFTFLPLTIISPVVGFYIGTAIIIYRNIFFRIIEIMSSSAVNKIVESKYRATTLSTFNMTKSLPYAVSAFVIGSLTDKFSANKVAFGLSSIFLLITIVFTFVTRNTPNIETLPETSSDNSHKNTSPFPPEISS